MKKLIIITITLLTLNGCVPSSYIGETNYYKGNQDTDYFDDSETKTKKEIKKNRKKK